MDNTSSIFNVINELAALSKYFTSILMADIISNSALQRENSVIIMFNLAREMTVVKSMCFLCSVPRIHIWHHTKNCNSSFMGCKLNPFLESVETRYRCDLHICRHTCVHNIEAKKSFFLKKRMFLWLGNISDIKYSHFVTNVPFVLSVFICLIYWQSPRCNDVWKYHWAMEYTHLHWILAVK